MEILTPVKIKRARYSRLQEVDFNKLEFGKYASDHMLVCDYYNNSWHDPHIVAYSNLSFSPATLALHYGQTVFEGMKAFRMNDDRINIFRIKKHHERFNRSLHRMCMPEIAEEIFTEGLTQLIKLDREWVPKTEGSSLYIRPFMYASEAKFGIKVSDEYRLIIFSGPVPSLFAKPIRVKVETGYIRAAKGGTGFAKCGGNYGGSFYPTHLAKQQGFDQVIWTDGKENRFIEESGMMNLMFVIQDKLVTAPLSDTILDGVTRDSLLTIARDMGIKTEERAVSVDELEEAFASRSITEAFGTGTAAVVAPIQTIHIEDIDYNLPAYYEKSVFNKLKQKLERIRSGEDVDQYKWNWIV